MDEEKEEVSQVEREGRGSDLIGNRAEGKGSCSRGEKNRERKGSGIKRSDMKQKEPTEDGKLIFF